MNSATMSSSHQGSIKTADTTPLLKWPGGKRKIAQAILPLIPSEYRRYYEPFFGAGALFFCLRPNRATLSDKNGELISLYQQIRDNPEAVIRSLSKLRNTEERYYAIRSSTPRTEVAKAARFIYLCTLAFNGIHRVNLRGEFNVPYGKKLHLTPCEPSRIRSASSLLQNTTLKADDFESSLADAGDGDIVYMDPPYTVAHGNNGFVKYNAKIFSWEDQERLATVAHLLARKGSTVIVSNADHQSIRRLYRDFRMITIERYSVIAASSRFRRQITECIFISRKNQKC